MCLLEFGMGQNKGTSDQINVAFSDTIRSTTKIIDFNKRGNLEWV